MAASASKDEFTATSLYVHVPFCVVKCGYCDFTSYAIDDPDVHDRFLRALDGELSRSGVPRRPSSVFLGGGTPTQLSPDRLERLFDILARHVDLASCAEVTMEANPESVTADRVSIARARGVTRVSMGVQSFDDRVLKFLDRVHSADKARRAFGLLRAGGFSNISIDLIFAIPDQTVDEWDSDLSSALALAPDHLSCYSLTFEAGTRLHRDLQQGRLHRIGEEVDRAMFLHTRERLGAAGFEPYEISNFAGPGGPCLHNDHYWLQGNYVGVGPGASSHRDGVRGKNLTTVESWATAVLAGTPATAAAETLRPRQRAGEAVWLGIRRRNGVDLAAAGRRLALPVSEVYLELIARQERAGWIVRQGDRIMLTAEGLLLADRVGVEYLV